MSSSAEFEEIAHSGGSVTVSVRTDSEGRRSYQLKWQHSRPNAASLFAVYAIPQGVAVRDIEIQGMGVPWNPPPLPDCYTVFITSDSTGMFGRQCPACRGYWRSRSLGKICPYCGAEFQESYELLTDAQREYVAQCCEFLTTALASDDGDHVIDMNAVADAVGKDRPLPAFYYSEERQQNLFLCEACGTQIDVLGRFAYCSLCGTRNDYVELRQRLSTIRDRIEGGKGYEDAVRDSVAAFDSFATQLVSQMRQRIPLTTARRVRLERSRFHNLQSSGDLLSEIFGIDILGGFDPDDITFLALMFHRRHVYEHKGGEADAKYIADSGDAVRVKQALSETRESAHRTVNLVSKLGSALIEGFHDIFPPLDAPIEWHRQRTGRSA